MDNIAIEEAELYSSCAYSQIFLTVAPIRGDESSMKILKIIHDKTLGNWSHDMKPKFKVEF